MTAEILDGTASRTISQPADMLNALMEQKNDICSRIACANEVEELEQAEWLIRFVASAWSAAGYGYKLREVKGYLRENAERMLKIEEYYLSNCRKNCKSRSSTMKDIGRLRKLISVF